MVDSCFFVLLSVLEARPLPWCREKEAMKLLLLLLRLDVGFLLIKMAIDTSSNEKINIGGGGTVSHYH